MERAPTVVDEWVKAPSIIAIGGHSLLSPDMPPTVANQFAVTSEAVRPIADLIERGEPLVLTHGNGPQVGHLLLQQEASHITPTLPLELLVAQTQGQLGYMIESTLDSQFTALGITPTPRW